MSDEAAIAEVAETSEPQAPTGPKPTSNLDIDPLDELFAGNGADPSDEEFARAMGAETTKAPKKKAKAKEPEAETEQEISHEEGQQDPEDDEDGFDDEEDEDEELSEVPVSRLESILDKLEAQAAAELGIEPTKQEEQAEEEAVPEQPIRQDLPLSFPSIELDESEHYEVMADHQNFNAYMRDVQAKMAESIIQQMGPAMLNAAIQVQAAMNFEKEIFGRFPELKGREILVKKAVFTAQKQAPGAGYDKWLEMASEELKDASVAEKALIGRRPVKDTRRNSAGQFAPRGTRPARTASRSRDALDGTQTALTEIANYGARSGAAMLSELGLD